MSHGAAPLADDALAAADRGAAGVAAGDAGADSSADVNVAETAGSHFVGVLRFRAERRAAPERERGVAARVDVGVGERDDERFAERFDARILVVPVYRSSVRWCGRSVTPPRSSTSRVCAYSVLWRDNWAGDSVLAFFTLLDFFTGVALRFVGGFFFCVAASIRAISSALRPAVDRPFLLRAARSSFTVPRAVRVAMT